MKLYIDTCVISGHAKGELTPNETAAFNRLLGQYASGEITLVTSTVAKDELNRIPMEYRASHEQVYQRLKEIPAAG